MKKNIIIDNYVKGVTKKKFLEILQNKGYSISYPTLKKWSDKLNLKFIEGRGKIPKIKFNPFYLGSFDNDYWLGYLLGDGSVANSIFITSIDLDHLSHYNIHLNKLGNFYYRNNIGVCYFGNKLVINYLRKIGIKRDKRYSGNYLFDLNFEIIRGLFDADGYCRVRNNSIEWKITSGNYKLIKKIEKFININGCNSSIKRKGNAYDIFLLGGKCKVVPFLNKLYQNGQYHLHRKYLKLCAFIEESINKNRVNCWESLRDKSTTK